MRHQSGRFCIPALAIALLPGCAVWDAVVQGDLSRLNAASQNPAIQSKAQATTTAPADPVTAGTVSSGLQQKFTAMAENSALFEDDNQPADDQAYLARSIEMHAAIAAIENLRPEQQQQLVQGGDMIDRRQGRDAYLVLSALSSAVSAQRMTYTLLQNASLQKMTRQADIYANPWMWSQQMMAEEDTAATSTAAYQ